MNEAPFFEPTDAGLIPHADARAPWSADMLHGRLLAGLAAWAVERDHGDAAFVPVRLTVDLYRSPAMSAVSAHTHVARAGGRVRAVDAVLRVDANEVGRASTLWLRRSEVPQRDETVPVTPNWAVDLPGDATPATLMPQAAFDVRQAGDRGFGAPGPGPRRVWLRDRRPLVRGEELTPFVRAALCADFASPLANSAEDGLDYINADMTLHLGRLPSGEWIGLETDDRVAADGVSVAQCRYYDAAGAIGWSSVCAVRTPRMPRSSPDGDPQ